MTTPSENANNAAAKDVAAVFTLDGVDIPFEPGETIMQAVRKAGAYIPHLCWHPDFYPQGSCRVCTVRVKGRTGSACTLHASVGAIVESDTDELNAHRKTLLQMLFVEGNHFCPSCEKSGGCLLQSTAYEMNMEGLLFDEFYPRRPIDASHPDILIDFNRCIGCELCVRASHDIDKKDVFAIAGHGIGTHIVINSVSGKLGDTDITLEDRAANICPTGAILPKRGAFVIPIGQRRYDLHPASDPIAQEAS